MTKPKLIRPAKDLPSNFRQRRHYSTVPWFIEIHVETIVNPSGKQLDDYIERLVTAGAGLYEPRVDFEIEYGTYGDRDRDNVTVAGWREATDDEITVAKEERAKAAEQSKAWEERQIEHLRRTRPELFK